MRIPQIVGNLAAFSMSFIITVLLSVICIMALTDVTPKSPQKTVDPVIPIATPAPMIKKSAPIKWEMHDDDHVAQSDRWMWENFEDWKPEDYKAITDSITISNYSANYGTDTTTR